jgi:predicted regulator of Ras-like GTPase activity (Roadblock/LC7/MglB family)
MTAGNVIITERDHSRFMSVLQDLDRQSNAKFVFLFDKSGQQVAATGDLSEVDPTSLASLTAGNVAATEGVAQLVGEDEFTTLFHEGKRESLHITVVGRRLILLVVFDERSSLGLVRLRVEQFASELGQIVEEMTARADSGEVGSEQTPVLGEITDADLDSLFGE